MLDFSHLYSIQIGDNVIVCKLISYDNEKDTYTISLRGNGVLNYVEEDQLEDITPSSPLPKEYQQVEWLKSSGTQYIDTGFSPNQKSRMFLDFEALTNDACVYAGARYASADRAFTINCGSTPKRIVAAFGSAANTTLSSKTPLGEGRCNAQIEKGGLYFNGEKKASALQSSWSTSNRVVLFACMQYSKEVSLYSSAKIYGCKIWDDETLERDLIPCIRKSDSVPGMYDIVGKQFYTNSGTGNFEVPYPYGYQQVEYIQGTGSQFLDTGVASGNDGLKIDIEYAPTSLAGEYRTVIGAYSSESSNTTRILQYYGAYTLFNLNTAASGGTSSTGAALTVNKVYTCHLEKSGFTSNGTFYPRTLSAKGTAFTGNIYVLSANGTPSTTKTMAKIYYIKLWNGDTLVRDMIPVYRKIDNVAGMLDLVSNTFYTNLGTGDDFTLGPDKN